jgi:ribosomal protein L35AE/L33A
VNAQAIDPRMNEALEDASSLQLYQLKAIIEGMLADPRRGLAARAELHLGQAVRFVDFRDGQMRSGKIIAFKDTQATVLERGTKRTWKIPCVSMQGYTEAERQDNEAPYVPPPEPVAATTKAREFQPGDTVTFTDRDGRSITGVVVRINQQTATIGTGDGGKWRVPFHMLRHVLDI